MWFFYGIPESIRDCLAHLYFLIVDHHCEEHGKAFVCKDGLTQSAETCRFIYGEIARVHSAAVVRVSRTTTTLR
jgi:hypothetical protein